MLFRSNKFNLNLCNLSFFSQEIGYKITFAPRKCSRPRPTTFQNVSCRFFGNGPYPNFKLALVGKFNDPKIEGRYDTGQIFLHKVFGYRGVILFPWIARVFDRDVLNKKEKKSEETPDTLVDDPVHYNQVGKEVRGRSSTFYQVLIDVRDCPHVRVQTEAVTFLGSQDSGWTLYAVPGLDYVVHEDVMPYEAVHDKKPLKHDLFQRFLDYTPGKEPCFNASETLKTWQDKNSRWLELSDVHKETTENVRVTVIPFYMGCRTSHSASVYWWRYCIRLENLGEQTVRVRERHWRIFSLSGTLETVRGRGIVGQEPVLSKEHPAFQYSSHVSLQAPSGHMWGTFKMEGDDGYTFDCRIPPFSLESKIDDSAKPTQLL